MTVQQIASILRQVAAYGALVVAAVPQTGLPPAARAVLGVFGAGIHWIEHYVGDPSTGKTTVTTNVGPPPPHA